MTLDDLDAAPLGVVVAMAGLEPKPERERQGGLYCSPCPCCGRESAHSKGARPDRRGPVHLRGGWACYGCEERGSRGDLVALGRLGKRWAACSAEERAGLLDAPPPERVIRREEAPAYLSAETWAALCSLSIPAWQDRACVRWAERRGLRLAPDLLAVVGDPVEGVPLWTEGGRWLPDFGARLLCPMADASGAIRGARLRSVRPDPIVKDQALRGLSARGLVYAPWRVRERWMAGEAYPGPVVLCEGKPDQLAAWAAWGRDVACLGFVEGSLSDPRWLGRDRLSGEVWAVYQEDKPDSKGKRKGEGYARRIEVIRENVRLVGVSAVWKAAGRAWEEGMDLGDLAGDLPEWKIFSGGA